MAGKNRKTKRKYRNDSSDESSEADKPLKKFKNISYVRNEKKQELAKTQQRLKKVCDSDDSNDDKITKKRPMSTLKVKNSTKNVQSSHSDDDSGSTSDDSIKKFKSPINKPSSSKTNIKKNIKVSNSKMPIMGDNSSSDSESAIKNTSLVNKNKLKSKEKKLASKSKKDNTLVKKNNSDSSSSKEFQQTQPEKKRKSVLKVLDRIIEDDSFIATPSKSDEENISVDARDEITLKSKVIEEFDTMRKLTTDIQDLLEIQGNYLINKKVKVITDSKFIAHKILRIYDDLLDKLRTRRNKYADVYKEWLGTFKKKRTAHGTSLKRDTSFKDRYKLSLEDSSENESQNESNDEVLLKTPKNKSKNLNKKSSPDNSNLKLRDSDLSEREEPKKTQNKLNLGKSMSKVADSVDIKNIKEKPTEIASKKSLKLNSSKNFEKSVLSHDETDQNVETNVSDCESEEIFSGEESNKKIERTISDKKSSENVSCTLEEPNETNVNSEEIFDSTASEIPNTPVKSPVLSSKTSLRKTLLLASKTFVPEEDIENDMIVSNIDNVEEDAGFCGINEHTEDTESEKKQTPENEEESKYKKLSDKVKENRKKKIAKERVQEKSSKEESKKVILGEEIEKELSESEKEHEEQNEKDKELLHEKSKENTETELENSCKESENENNELVHESKETEREKFKKSKNEEIKKTLHEESEEDKEIENEETDCEESKETEKIEQEESVIDSDLEARKKLLQDSELSSPLSESESAAEESNTSINSCSTLILSKSSPLRQSENSKKKKKLKKSLMQTKKSLVSLDSSSDSAAGKSRFRKRKTRSSDTSDDLPTRNRRRRNYDVRNNRHFKADKKLRMACRVVVERLSENELEKYSRAFDKSKAYIANKKFLSLTNLDGLEAKKKSKSQLAAEGSTSNGESDKSIKGKKKNRKGKKTSKNQVKEDNDVESDADVSNKADENEKSVSCSVSVEQDFHEEAEKEAKEALLNSSNSSDGGATEEDEGEKTQSTNDKVKKKRNEEKDDSSSEKNDEAEESDEDIDEEPESVENDKKKDKSDWTKDELLNFRITDSEEEKSKKSRDKKKAKLEKKKHNKNGEEEEEDEEDAEDDEDDEDEAKPENDTETSDKSPIKKSKKGRKQRKARRILDSDSDAKIDSGEESDDSDEGSEFEEDKKDEEKKKKGRKRRTKSSESDTSSSEKKPKSKRKRIKKAATDDSDSDKDSPGKGRKNIRKVLKDKNVTDDTKKAAQIEEERLKRIAERQRLFNEMYDAKLAGEAKVDKLVLDFDEETKKELVVVDAELVKRLKPHQAQGIKFMWDACFESLKQIEESEGSGCIIAHCMGLGKTFQVVTLAHTLLSHEETGVNTIMVVCPLSTVLNWVNEFNMWLKHTKNGDEIEIYELTKLKKNNERKYMLESWQKTGGVLIIGYEMFRNLTSTGKKMRKAMQESITRSLVNPGADLVVCDEGHLLKNEDSALSKAMKLVKTQRRIVLTGTPLQNNLKEYHCMVQFVKPMLLGTKKEFLNRFVNPITNGQFDDSTTFDVKLMKKRAHVLHKMLEGSVQRFDYSVLTPFLPPKQEYVIFVRLTEVQIKMYQHYLDNFARRFSGRNGSLFADFQELQRIWTHPYVLRLNAAKIDKANEKKRLEASDSEGSLKDFIDDDEDSESEISAMSTSGSGSGSDVQCIDSDTEKRPVKMTRSARMTLKEELQEEVPTPQVTTEETAWWSKFVEEKHFEDMRISTKLMLLFGILHESEQIGDKVLVFSQSLYSLTLIENFLNLIDQETQNDVDAEHLENHRGTWSLGLDYFRLDGSTSAENRSAWCKIFNNPKNTRARLFLISTRAGGLGINLTAANRVIIFDASWNPSHDVQSIFRIYRFGQKKPCYIYRFLAAGTMEEKIYNRQVTKLSLACRVVDEQQIERHYSNNDLAELYQFESYEGKSTTLNLPKDRMLAEIFLKYKDLVYTYHEHDSLLENKEEEELDEEERKQAWLEYEEEKQGKRQIVNMGPNNMLGFNQMLMNMNNFPELESIKLLIQKDYPNLPPEHLETVARQAVFDMYRFVDQQAINPVLNPFANQLQGGFGAPTAGLNQMTQQQQTINMQNQLMNTISQPQHINYPGVNHMPAYSGRGRPPKHLSNPAYNMNVNRQMPMQMPMQTPMQVPMQPLMQPQQSQIQNQQQSDEIEVLSEKQVTPPASDTASNINDKPEE